MNIDGPGVDDFIITETRLYLKRKGDPGLVTVNLYAADASGFPTGPVLSTGTIDSSELSSSNPTSWTIGDTACVVAMSSYTVSYSSPGFVIVVTCDNYSPEWPYPDVLYWHGVATGAYTFGHASRKDSGVWVDNSPKDMRFAVYGDDVVVPPEKPINPTPDDESTTVAIGQETIAWEDGGGATSYNVYYGVDEAGLTLVSSGQTGTSFSIWHIENGSPFVWSDSRAWRIDAVNDAGTTAGDVWTFTAINGYPSIPATPDPADEDTDVDIDGADDAGVVLTWDVSTCARSYDVYFGTDPTPDTTEFIRNQNGTSYNAGVLKTDTTYYWRIDSVNDQGTTTGNVWQFTTESSP